MNGLGRLAVQLGSLQFLKLRLIEQCLLDVRVVVVGVRLVGVERLPNGLAPDAGVGATECHASQPTPVALAVPEPPPTPRSARPPTTKPAISVMDITAENT